MTVARIALPIATDRLFDYWIPDGSPAERGSIVRVRLARRALVGVVAEIGVDSDVVRERLQAVEQIAALPPLPDDVLGLARFVAG
jgi:primosomal protein N' (replication factor Y)